MEFEMQTSKDNSNLKDKFLITGDTLFCGDVGRPDLAVNNSKEITIDTLSEMLFKSIQKLKKLDDECIVLPGHGAGSPCGKKISSSLYTTIKNERMVNKAFSSKNI